MMGRALLLLLAAAMGLARAGTDPGLIAADDFASFDTGRWAVEAEGDPPRPVHAEDHRLVLESARGLTVWYRQKLSGHYEIDFTRRLPFTGTGAPFERVSDLNLFWLAQLGADGEALFSRSGKLSDYDTLPLYYAGIGGNDNTTTRFRHYDQGGQRPLLKEYTTAPYLLTANHDYRIRVVVDGEGTRLYVDGSLYFSAPGPLPEGGYFAFRSTKSRQTIADFSIHRLP
jgi:hypothetical protein